MKAIYLGLAILGAVVPYWFLVPWLAQHGLDLPALVTELFSTKAGAFFGTDVIVSAVVLFAFMGFERNQRRVRHLWVAIAGTLAVGVSFGFPLYLFLREASPGSDKNSSTR